MVAEKLNKHEKSEKRYDGEGVFHVSKIEQGNEMVIGFMSSGRIQNLEYQCEQLWGFIKKDGVIEMNCPILMEADGQYFSNENEEE
ncbi:MAG: hypothetical protein GTO02_15550 [Candidatus Dadabacteria bacterium]|nr:hypothetical protein [Candidatus Dadabacteria bacterium]